MVAALPAVVNSPPAYSSGPTTASALTLAVPGSPYRVKRPVGVSVPPSSRTTPEAGWVSAAVKLPPT